MQKGILVACFVDPKDARQAVWELEKHRFFHSAVLYKDKNGRLEIRDPFVRRRSIGFLIFLIVSLALSSVLAYRLASPVTTLPLSPFPEALVLGMLAAGFLAAIVVKRKYFGIDAKHIQRFSKLLFPDETQLILQAEIPRLSFATQFLREKSSTPLTIFVLHPSRERRTKTRHSVLHVSDKSVQSDSLTNSGNSLPVRNALLKKLRYTRQWVHQICSDLTEASRLRQGTTPVAEWIIDNEYLVVKNIRDVLQNLPKKFYQELPRLKTQPKQPSLPYIYALAKRLTQLAEQRLTRENILEQLANFQLEQTLSIAELWAFPQFIRIALIESIQGLAIGAQTDLCESQEASYWANRLIVANNSKDESQIFSVLAELTEQHPKPNAYFGTQMVDHLYDEASVLIPVQNWLERVYGCSLNELVKQEQHRLANDQLSISNAFTSLKQIQQLDWREIFEAISSVEQILRRDPDNIYRSMDFTTRDHYRQAVEQMAVRSGLSEEEVARRVVAKSAEGLPLNKDETTLEHHIGSYLIGPLRSHFMRELQCQESPHCRFNLWVRKHHASVYLYGLGLLTLLFSTPVVLSLPKSTELFQITLLAWLTLFPASQLAAECINLIVTRFMSPDILPKLDLSSTGIPDRLRTLVVVPTLLLNEASIKHEIEKLEIRYMANRDTNLIFSLFSDFTDAHEVSLLEDQALLSTAIKGIDDLNRKHGNCFLLFHRERNWCETEQKYIGWERKRGKLEQLNQLLANHDTKLGEELLHAGNYAHLGSIRFVITLDSDTQLPHNTARRMIETLAHPLNQAKISTSGEVISGFTIIQPRVTSSLPSSSYSPFSKLFCNTTGLDPYSRVVSDVYQDLTGEGTYHGKGIYDVQTFNQVLSARFPEGLILSHDLIEGAHVRVGLASDIELFDEYPPDYLSYSARLHRWIRGDWQIAAWLFPKVPTHHGPWAPNPLKIFDRWKVFDNLRRSLLPLAILALLAMCWLICKTTAIVAMSLTGAALFSPLLSQIVNGLTRVRGIRHLSLRDLRHTAVKTCLEIALLPHQATVALNAIVRTWYRMLISHRGLLEWTSSQVMHCKAEFRRKLFLLSLGTSSLFGLGMFWLIHLHHPETCPTASPWLALWTFAPLCGWWLTHIPTPSLQRESLPYQDRIFLRKLTRKTWRYFDDFVNEGSNWLPPDNYQVSHQNKLAMRTSPTNIGMWLLSCLGGFDCGYQTPQRLVARLKNTLQSIASLQKFRGHLFNWYDISTLSPLEPRYISSVDSGNLLASIWALCQGLEELADKPAFRDNPFFGFRDTTAVLEEAVGKDALFRSVMERLVYFSEFWREFPKDTNEQIALLRQSHLTLSPLISDISNSASETGEVFYWGNSLSSQLHEWNEFVSTYLGWHETLAKTPDVLFDFIDDDLQHTFKQAMTVCPSLRDISLGNVEIIHVLRNTVKQTPRINEPLARYCRKILAEFEAAQQQARSIIAEIDDLTKRFQEFSDALDMQFLYDRNRKLFSIGFNVSSGTLDNSFYDLLASEARLGSYTAIARGDIPMDHWFSMGRSHSIISGRRMLLSWSGTMFEYLMPQLLQKSYSNSLLDNAIHRAVQIQMRYGARQGVPWGISESAYGDLDINKTYQYMAFGVPQLGLKRVLKNQLVVAPYATILATELRPFEVVANLKKLSKIGLLDHYGFYEAIDYSRTPVRGGERGVIIKAYMAHHQGMGFIALINFLYDNPFRERFHRDPRVKAFELLLQEKVPHLPPLKLTSSQELGSTFSVSAEVAAAATTFDTPHTYIPKTRLLSNGSYTTMITNAGGGFSAWQGQDLFRWRSDRTCENGGNYLYIHDTLNDLLWSAAHQPACAVYEDYVADFGLDRVVIKQIVHDIQSELEVVVSPEDDIEIRRLSLFNRSGETRTLKVTSYCELSLAPHRTDRQHPAFNKLFIKTEALPDARILLAERRPRGAEPANLYIAHCLVGEDELSPGFEFETDRCKFIGRGRTLLNPLAAGGTLQNSEGFVLDPIFSIQQPVVLEPNQRVEVTAIYAVSPLRENALALARKYQQAYQISRSLDFAWRATQVGLRLLHIQHEDARWYQHLANHIIFPNRLLSPPRELVRENHKGQSGLWPYGISGDLPIVLVTIAETRDLNLIRQLIQAHSYWRMQGFLVDLVILNEEIGSYGQPLREQLIHLIQAYSNVPDHDHMGGVFLRSSDEIPEEDLRLLKTAASIYMVAARGPLSQQLGIPRKVPDPPELLTPQKLPKDAPGQLAPLSLRHYNGYGGFTEDGQEYVVTAPIEKSTPAPWVNVIANPFFGTMVSECGNCFSWFGNSQRNRLSPWSNDPVEDTPGEVIYVRDEDSGAFWSPTPLPAPADGPYRTRHGAGYTRFEHQSHGLCQEILVVVPTGDDNTDPIKLQQVYLRNDTERARRISVTYYVDLVLGEHPEASGMHTITVHDRRTNSVFAFNRYHPEYSENVTFISFSRSANSFCGDRVEFIGRNHSLANPLALQRVALSGRVGERLDPCAAVQVSIRLEAGEEQTILTMLGQAQSQDEARHLVEKYRKDNAFVDALAITRAWWENLLGKLTVNTPDPLADVLINRWLLYQSLSCRIWGRSALYQSGGAYGYRDQLQDVGAFLTIQPELAKAQIELAASRQFTEGDVQHWWHPPTGAGIRSKISDDLLWLPWITAQYVKVTGDVELLRKDVPFLNAPQLEADQHEVFSVPETTIEQATIFEHCRRAVEKGLTHGPHNLPLFGTGDWNDGMNLVGAEGRGESVWLGWFLVDVLKGMAEMARLIDEHAQADEFIQKREALIEAIESFAWDGSWYLRGTFDDGSLLGATSCSEAQIDSLPQSWAWLSEAASQQRATQALESAWERLVRTDESLIQLFDPPFQLADPSPGYIKGYPPGVRENGGQYTHAAIWFAMAMARKGDGDRAVKMLNLMNPVRLTSSEERVERYVVEPYVVAADVYRLPGRIGRGGWTWYTGSAAWMHRAWTEEVLGLKVREQALYINPVIPKEWDGYTATYQLNKVTYRITVNNTLSKQNKVQSIAMDGEILDDNFVPLDRQGKDHEVVVTMV